MIRMRGLLAWFNELENRFLALHVLAVFVLGIIAEYFFPYLTTLTFPALILLVSASFMWNYPVEGIKAHGLFSEFVIELRLLWLVIIGLLLELALFTLFRGPQMNRLLPAAGLVVGLAIAFLARNHLQERLVKARGFK